jgi:hypothetical protein
MTAIRATFSQYAMVKTRGVLVLHMEVPLEQQAEVFKVLGYPLPGEEVWCGIARLNPRAGAEPEPALDNPSEGPNAFAAADEQDGGLGRTVGSIPATGANYEIEDYDIPPNDYSDEAVRITASERGKTRYASASDMERARTRAALLPKDARFILWVEDQRGYAPDEGGAEHYIRDTCCAGESRKLIAEDEMCYRAFIAMETDYLLSIGALPEVR